jgi:hypothetical protein
MPLTETYEQAVARTGRKWPYRTADWPCPACGEASCDLDIDLVWNGRARGVWTFTDEVRFEYRHVENCGNPQIEA